MSASETCAHTTSFADKRIRFPIASRMRGDLVFAEIKTQSPLLSRIFCQVQARYVQAQRAPDNALRPPERHRPGDARRGRRAAVFDDQRLSEWLVGQRRAAHAFMKCIDVCMSPIAWCHEKTDGGRVVRKMRDT